jgi:hypothetical protein
MTLQYTGERAACVRCGDPTVFRDTTNGEPRHVGNFCAPPPAGPRPAATPRLDEPLTVLAGELRSRIEAIADQLGGDLDRILKKSVPLVMDLFEHLRTSGRYPLVHHPPYPPVLAKQRGGTHQIWLARPKWTNNEPAKGPVDRLDVPGAYLAAFTTWLPVQALQHDTSGSYDPRKSGVYLITPPAWEIGDLPNPLGNREEPGPLWVADPTLRNLLRAHVKYQLCDSPIIHEAWTAPATEDMLTGLKKILAYLRSLAIAEKDQLLALVVKNMYSKFYATIGESNQNHRLKRPEWSFIIQAQAHWNLWERAYRARQAGLQVVHVGGTDELHLVGDWRLVWTEGNELPQMKIKED